MKFFIYPPKAMILAHKKSIFPRRFGGQLHVLDPNAMKKLGLETSKVQKILIGLQINRPVGLAISS